jgi:hypothetical protein
MYPVSMRLATLALVAQGRSLNSVSKKLGISRAAIAEWRAVAAPGVVVVQNSWKHWACLFPQHGPGRKHERALAMAQWQWAIVEQHPDDFLRGLFHSDGCRANNWASRMVAGKKKKYFYPRWQFTNHSAEIRGWCCDALDLVGVPWRASRTGRPSPSPPAPVWRSWTNSSALSADQPGER